MKNIETERLRLRDWQDDDVLPYYEMGQDRRVIEYFSSLWSQYVSIGAQKINLFGTR